MNLSESSTDNPATTTLFICALCDKPFTKEQQHRRHTAYCSKAPERRRPRSCKLCNQAKIKCNYESPCHQCVRKGKKCVYDVAQRSRRKQVAAKRPMPVTSATEVPDHQERDRNVFGTLVEEQVSHDVDVDVSADFLFSQGLDSWVHNAEQNELFQVFEDPLLPSITAMKSLAESDIFPPFLNHCDYNLDFLPAFSLSSEKSLYPAIQSTSSTNYLNQQLRTPSPYSSTALTPTRHFSRNAISPTLRTISNLLTNIIRAYPTMMTRRTTLPPFIHAFTPSSPVPTCTTLPTHITTCMGIAQLFVINNRDLKVFIWSTIRSEMRRFRERIGGLDRYEAFSAMQAALVYAIVRAMDEEAVDGREDWEMLVTYKTVTLRAIELTSHSLRIEDVDKSFNQGWREWIIDESGRRVACVWFILGLLFHVRTGHACFVTDHFRQILLPCPKAEWEASTEAAWLIEHEHSLRYAHERPLRTFGDLLDANADERKMGVLDRWNAEVDGLGMAMNLAVCLV